MTGAEAQPIRDAATVILYRDGGNGPSVLMGQRGAGAAFMPMKFVFPGGAVDAADAEVPLISSLDPVSAARLDENAPPGIAHALAAAAIRELWEEAGLPLGAPSSWPAPPPDWEGFAATGLAPDAGALRYIFRAITPPGRPRRFDARFFLAPITAVPADPDDFSHASDELSYLRWVPIAEARMLNLPFITEVVLAEAAAFLRSGREHPESVPFFDNSGETSRFLRIA
ncbi:NUDIX hydrolase [Ostreiculturibacter nitratireducens]|uniref:NUDIX hydrolase n=1 Tax=Ostreiculturibacter nitratireducens TaxID=3075226 RepID=UPI0031B60A9E